MRRGMAGIVVLSALALAACSSGNTSTAVDPNLAPAEWERELLNTLRTSVDNPVNIREASVSAPVLRSAGQEQRYSACVRYNARDMANRYMGVKEQIGWFYGGHLNQVVDAAPGQCAGAAYRPWPALEQLCQAKKCE